MGDEPSRSSDPQSELQAESDRAQMEFLRTDLQTCFTFAEVAEAEHGRGNLDHALRSLEHAETGYATIVRLMSDPKHQKHITEQEWSDLKEGLEGLRSTLDRLAKALKT